MKCPYCEGELVSGRVFIHGRLIDFLMVGLSSQQLWFARDGDPKEEEILSSWGHDAAGGHRCTACGAVLIRGNSPTTRSDAGRKHERHGLPQLRLRDNRQPKTLCRTAVRT